MARIRKLGHPRLYATHEDETLNGILAVMAEAVHPRLWDTRMFERLDLGESLGGL